MDIPEYEILALRYCHNAGLMVSDSFLFHKGDDHQTPGPMDFFVWLIRGHGHNILVDTGFGEEAAIERKRTLIRNPIDALAAVGAPAEEIRDVVLTHLDYDHSGNIEHFPNATFHLQDAEMEFATGRLMTHKHFRITVRTADILNAVKLVHESRFKFHNGTAQIKPGVTVHLVGGHSGGMQVVRVRTARGWVVLTSDASHYYRNIRRKRPHPVAVDIGKVLEGYRLCEELADSPDHIIPGHDPEVMRCFPAYQGMADVVRVDLPPIAPIKA